jgi:peptidoglycan/xylan/chitin deacetylase (PgdA/CDA1 family)
LSDAPGTGGAAGADRRRPWGPGRRRAAVTISFDNLGEVTDLQRGLWPDDEPLGQHFSVTRALPRILALLGEVGLRATFFVEGRNTELYPGTLVEIAAAGHEVAYHGWCHEQWAQLTPTREAELLQQGVHAMDELGLRPLGFRPPGGRLTSSSLSVLHDLGFTHCSPAGTGVGVRRGLLVLPFRWRTVDAYHYLARFGALRQRDRGSAEAVPANRFGETLDAALADAIETGRHLPVVFHPFLAEPDPRFDVMRRHLAAVRSLVDDGRLWCAPHRDVAAWMSDTAEGGAGFEELRLDATAP